MPAYHERFTWRAGRGAGARLAALAASERRACLFSDYQQQACGPVPARGFRWLAGLGSEAQLESGGAGQRLSEEVLSELDAFIAQNRGQWIMGHINYDLKNILEPGLQSRHKARSGFPDIRLFVPETVLEVEDRHIGFWSASGKSRADEIFRFLGASAAEADLRSDASSRPIMTQLTESDYRTQFDFLHNQIVRGNTYEVNYCIPFRLSNCRFDPLRVWLALQDEMPAPFSVFYHSEDSWLLSASPERFLHYDGERIYSQPIKGTRARHADPELDTRAREELRTNEKERSENIMITDLVRNDLSRIARRNSVRVDELCGIYSFSKVHQMISTISAVPRENTSFSEILKALFPMGSMTGAPKISTMQLIDEAESFRRELFSGSVFYIRPDGRFDMNVVIRSILYRADLGEALIAAGSAITAAASASEEYYECLLKSRALLGLLGLTPADDEIA